MLMNPAPAIDIGVALTAALTIASRPRRWDFDASKSRASGQRWSPWLLLVLLAVLTIAFAPIFPDILAWTASEGFSIPH